MPQLIIKNKLAIGGGAPTRSTPFAPWPYFSEGEITAAADVLRSGKVNYWTGTEGRMFEREFAASVARPHAIAVANGTAALEIALRVLGIGPGDEVIVPSRTFIASASCVVMNGARPVFADVDMASQNLTLGTISRVVTPNTRAIIPVHLAGWPCDMQPIVEFARARGIKVIEDCAQAQGATYQGRPAGSLADIAAFSFCQDKIMSTGGEGGMIVTSDAGLWEQAWSFKDHGKNYHLCHDWQPSAGYRWIHESFGTNLRMTEMQSAIGRVLLRKLDQQLEVRRRHAAILTEAFSQLPSLRVTLPPATVQHAYYKYYAFLRLEQLREGWTRDRVIEAIRAEGIPCLSGSCSEVYREKAFSEELRPSGRYAVARELGDTSLMFLVHPTLSVNDMSDTARAVEKVLEAATSIPYSEMASA
jgi:dTDP-4-amino-4,6-dideoxygalactose transaminase